MLSGILAGQLRPDVDLPGQELAVARFEQDVVERDALVGDAVLHREKPPRPTGRNRSLPASARFRVPFPTH